MARPAALCALFALPLVATVARPAIAAPAWPDNLERLMAIDAAVNAPPDLKRQLAKHRDRLLAGVADAVAGETGERTAALHRAAAARGARLLAASIREHRPFDDVAYEMGGIVHELAAATPPPPPASAVALQEAARHSRFLGFPPDPFRDPQSLVSLSLPATTSREAFDAVVTQATRLAAWVWKAAGGDASVALTLPESKGPYVVRD